VAHPHPPAAVSPAKFVFAESGRTGSAVDSIVSAAAFVSGGMVKNSILSPDVRVNSYSRRGGQHHFSHVNIDGTARSRRRSSIATCTSPKARDRLRPEADKQNIL